MPWLQNKFEEWVFRETLRMNERGLPVDTQLIRNMAEFVEWYAAKRITRFKQITGGIAPTQVGVFQQWLSGIVPEATDLKKVTLNRILNSGVDPDIEEAIRIRLEQGQVSTKKLYKAIDMDSGDARIRGCFIYHGAGPGRFTAVGLQPQNFKRPVIKQNQVDEIIGWLLLRKFEAIVEKYNGTDTIDVMEAIGSCMRGVIKAPPGYMIVRADYNAIEARVLAWLARQKDLVLAFHARKDIYIDMAADIFGIEAEIIAAGHAAGKVEESEQRKLGKDTILGCGYQMWINTFLGQLEDKGNDTVAGIPIRLNKRMIGQRDEESFNPAAVEMAKSAVFAYRDKYRRIKSYWGDIGVSAIGAIRQPGFLWEMERGRIRFKMHPDRGLEMRLPAQRSIWYPDARVFEDYDFKGNPRDSVEFHAVNDRGVRVWEKMYGGKWTENAVQGIARDLMVHGMYQASKEGFANIGTVHDEIITLYPRCNAHRVARRFEQIICRMPKWAIGDTLDTTIPLTAEGAAGVRYGK